jgi:hypothetical protein
LLLASALTASTGTAPHVADGPAAGSSGRFALTIPTMVAADGRAKAAPRIVPGARPPELAIPDLPDRADAPRPSVPRGANERNDSSRSASTSALLRTKGSTILAGFHGFSDPTVRPPDPVVAAGPDHVVVAVNGSWGIYTKAGTRVFETTAFGWFLPVLTQIPNGDLFPYDPQVAYDPLRGRWILLYSVTDLASESYLLLSVSSSSDPTAPWFSWALPGDVNGATATGTFADFAMLGYDDTAIYVSANQFGYTDQEFHDASVRILPKEPLYAGSPTAAWLDFWNLTDPVTGANVHTVRPAYTFGTPGVEYLVSNSPFDTRTFVTLWTLAGAGTAQPSLSADDVSVAATAPPPGANQEGGSPGSSGCSTPCLLNTGIGVVLSTVFRNGSVWFSHAVADQTGTYSRARYARIRVASKTVLEDESFGAEGCWYFYPAIAVDAGDNLSMVFGRSCTDAYAGVGLTVRTISDAALEPSVILKDGLATYVVPVGSGEPVNRWGDYFGAAADPSDPGRIWTHAEYADLGERWSTWIAETTPSFSGGSCVPDDTSLCLGDGRFRATASWKKADGSSGSGQAAPVTGDTGYFWFFDASNIEVVAKVLDACGVNGRFWVFLGGLTNLDVTLTVADTKTGAARTYVNAAGVPFAPVQDTSALPCP